LHTLALSILALQVQEGAAPLGDVNVVDLLKETGTVNLIVLAILVLLSVVSWAIIFQKTLSYRSIQRQTATFLDVFRRSTKFSEVQSVCPSLPASPLVGVFQAGYAELNAQFRVAGTGSSNPGEASSRPILKSLAAVDRALLRAAAVEVNKLEKRVPFLATIASVAPFIGLFGTVWGIYHALVAIGVAGQASIDKVAGPVGEALIMTAVGLAVAVPAVLGYNFLLGRNKQIMERVKLFSNDLEQVIVSGSRIEGTGAKVISGVPKK
jgi:biopolymer transport protein ExbB/TolQ